MDILVAKKKGNYQHQGSVNYNVSPRHPTG